MMDVVKFWPWKDLKLQFCTFAFHVTTLYICMCDKQRPLLCQNDLYLRLCYVKQLKSHVVNSTLF